MTVMPKAVVTVDHVATGLSRLFLQFKSAQPIDNPAGRTNIEKLTAILLQPFQELEEVFQQLIQLRTVFTAVGSTLDAIGDLVGQERGSLAEEDYRRILFAVIAANFSDGRRETIINIARLLLNDPDGRVVIQNLGPAAAIVRIDNALVDDFLAATLISLLRRSVPTGVRVDLQSSPDDEQHQFTLATTAFASAPLTIGMLSLPVTSTDDFPATGLLDIDFGLSVYEQVAYTGITRTSFTLATALTKAHLQRCNVQLLTAENFNTSFGDSSDVGQPDLTPYSTTSTIGGSLIDQR